MTRKTVSRSGRLLQVLVAAGCLSAALPVQALAQSAPQAGLELGRQSGGRDSIAGDWLFDTSEFSGDCVIKGKISFKRATAPNAYTCVFVSEQICGPKYFNTYIKVNQSCVAQKVGKQVAITSVVEDIVESRAEGRDIPTGYWADNFVVSLTKSMLEMVGDHYDEQRELKARFWRDVDLVS